MLAVVRELGIGFVAYSPLGHGFLTGQIRTTDDFADDDWRKTNPRFMGENFERNLRIADEVAAVAADAGATPAQVALAWLLSKGDDIVPIPGTKRTARVEENCAADGIELSPDTDPEARQPHPRGRWAPQRGADAAAPALTVQLPRLQRLEVVHRWHSRVSRLLIRAAGGCVTHVSPR